MSLIRNQAGLSSDRRVAGASERILKHSPLKPALAIVLGSGLRTLLDHFQIAAEIPYSEIPGFPRLRVPGHEPRIVSGRWGSVPLFIVCGRAHYYEGHSMDAITFPIRVLAKCGIRTLLLTNAAGGINPKFRTGDLMILTDHINWMGVNPLRGAPDGDAPPFVDLSQVYDPELSASLLLAGKAARIPLQKGTYLAVSGPTYETPAEIRAFASLGADAVGMSTVPEAVVARSCGVRVAGLSLITNLAAGRNREPLSHAEVLKTAKSSGQKLAALLTRFLPLVQQ